MLHREKAEQAHALLHELDLDCWLTFGRETGERPDPGVELVVGTSVTWNSAFLLGKDGTRVAIVGRFDTDNVRNIGVFSEIIGYDEDLREPLLHTLERIAPRQIGLNYSLHDHTADGLTYGMFLLLQELLAGTAYTERLTSAGPLLSRLRARKTPSELARIQAAVDTTEEIIAWLTPQLHHGRSESEIAALVHGEFRRRDLPSSWDWDYCPTVNSGPDSPLGHVQPQPNVHIGPGHLIHIDLGVRQEEYCSDIQRMWYVRRPGESGPPAEIQRAWDTVVRAIEAGAATLKPGVIGWEVDAVARQVIVDGGYPEYKHALGHGLGRACHDGGPLLGPRWPRYGDSPFQMVEEGNVYTLELGINTAAGYIGLEEDVVVTATGCRFLSRFQRELILV
ncbi:MAG: Xaa-Pro peptidase family protein [Chloroflexaceae bacterium]|jgi:Xaa-Pro aminopeptidase|nr:Xaa-Pro peptidase family protein [Chloroflexaceae bacterium]